MAHELLTEPQAKEMLAACGIRTPQGAFVRTAHEAASAAAAIGFPVVLKLVSPDVVHKSEAHGVVLGLGSESAVESAAGEIAQRCRAQGWRLDGFLVEETIRATHEVIVGGVIDARFGPMLMVGLGGIFVEVFDDVALAVCPIDRVQAQRMIRSLRSARMLLESVRGRPAASEPLLVEALLLIGGPDGFLMKNAARVESLDVNPLMLDAQKATAADVRIIPRSAPLRESSARREMPDFSALFAPKTVGVAGASSNRITFGNIFIQRLRDYGYDGEIYPIHPQAAQIEDLQSYTSLQAVPKTIDYLYVAVPPDQVAELLTGANGHVRFAQIITSGFSEVEEGAARQERLETVLHDSRVRVLGPNCLGTHSPRGHLTFLEHVSSKTGTVGIVSQSGGLSIDISRRGRGMGIEFSGIVTIGNSIDLTAADLLEFYARDSQTRVIGAYVEDVKDGRRFFEALEKNRGEKPVVLLVGGRTAAGRRAATSHTGALASDGRIWDAIARQTGAVLVDTLEEFLDALLAFQFLTPHMDAPSAHVVLFGNGGGASVLATDDFARKGLDVGPLPRATLDALERLGLPPGSSIVNPIDTPAGTLRQEEGRIAQRIIEAVFSTSAADAFVMHLNLPAIVSFTDRRTDILGNLMQAALELRSKYQARTHFVLVLRSTGEPELEERRHKEVERATAMGIPVYAELQSAANALAAVAFHERNAR
jgi:acyl-CoA synthetase (NDP forming)